MKTIRIGQLVVMGILTTASIGQTPGPGSEWAPWGSYVELGYSASPSAQIITADKRQTIYTQTGVITDKDTWRLVSNSNVTQVFPQPMTDIELDHKSGTLVAVNNAYNGDTGQRTKTYILYPKQDVESTETFHDTFTFYDTAPRTGSLAVLRDLDGQTSTNVVQYQ